MSRQVRRHLRLAPFVALLLLAAPRRSALAEDVRWASSFANAMEQAGAEQKYVMIDFFTVWCHWCKVLDAKTYSDGRVIALTDRMVSVKVNAEIERDVAAKYGVRAYPTIVFLNPDGTLRRRVQGFQPPERFAPLVAEVLSTDAEQFALEQQVRSAPGDGRLRLEYSRLLARGGRLEEAVAQIDTLLAADDLEERDRLEPQLERWIHLVRQGREAEEARKGLEKFAKKQKSHPRRAEAIYFLGRARELEGKTKDARKSYEEIAKLRPGSWYAESARERLQALS